MIKKITPFTITAAAAVLFVASHFVAAVLLYKERLFLDSTYYFFHVLNEESFRIEHQRIILALSQCLLLAGVKMHLSTTALLKVYSVTPVIYTAILIFITIVYFKSEAGAWLIILCNTCGVYFLYFSPMYEVCYAVTTLGFLWVLTERRFYQTPVQAFIYLVLLMVALLGYPLIAFGCIFIPAYHYLTGGKKLPFQLVAMYAFAFAVWLAMKFFFISDYEKSKISIAPAEYPGIIKALFSPQFFVSAVKYLTLHYKENMLAAAVFVAIATRGKRYGFIALQLISIAAFVWIVNFGYRADGLIHSNNFERMYLLLVPLCFAPLLLIAYPGMATWSKTLLVACLFGVGCYKSLGLWQHSSYYTQRLQMLSDFKDNYAKDGCTKLAADLASFAPELDEWSTGMEMLIYSSERGKGCIVSDKPMVEKLNQLHAGDNNYFIIRLDEVMKRSELNPRYFNLDTSAYCFVSKK